MWGEWWEWWWEWWSYSLTGDFGPSCGRGDVGGVGSSGSSSRPLCPPQLPLLLAFASEPERGAGGGICGGCLFGVVMGATRKSVDHQKRFHGSIIFRPVATQRISWESFFLLFVKTPPPHVTLSTKNTQKQIFHHTSNPTFLLSERAWNRGQIFFSRLLLTTFAYITCRIYHMSHILGSEN